MDCRRVGLMGVSSPRHSYPRRPPNLAVVLPSEGRVSVSRLELTSPGAYSSHRLVPITAWLLGAEQAAIVGLVGIALFPTRSLVLKYVACKLERLDSNPGDDCLAWINSQSTGVSTEVQGESLAVQRGEDVKA